MGLYKQAMKRGMKLDEPVQAREIGDDAPKAESEPEQAREVTV